MNQLTTRTASGPAVLRGWVSEPAQLSVDGQGVLVGADRTFQTTADIPAGGTKDVTLKAADASGNTTTQVWRLVSVKPSALCKESP